MPQATQLFNHYHDLFYSYNEVSKKYTKIVPVNILDLMDPIVLAFLIKTDGNFDKGRNRIRIYTNSFCCLHTKAEVVLLANAINTNLGIYTGVLHDRNNQWILTIGATQLNKLRELVKPYFIFLIKKTEEYVI